MTVFCWFVCVCACTCVECITNDPLMVQPVCVMGRLVIRVWVPAACGG